MRAAALSLALLLVLSAVAGAVPALGADAPNASASDSLEPVSASPPLQVSPPNETGEASPINVLGIPPNAATRSSLKTEYVELGSGLAFGSRTAEGRLETTAVVERIESAGTADRRQQYLLQEVSTIEQRVITLRTRQQQAVAAYGRDELTPRRLLYELAVIDAEARELQQRRDRLQGLADSTPGFSISSSRFGNIELELNTLAGPVRGHAASVLNGEAESTRFFVQSGDDSVELAVIRDGTYVREVYRGPLRVGNGESFTLGDAVNATEQAYPTITALRLRDDVVGNPESDSTRVTIEHERGRLVAFVDSGSERVFKEYQYRPIDRVRTTSATSAIKDGLELTAHRTYPGGPVRLQLNSTENDEPVDAQLTVGPAGGRSSVVGRTGGDGSLWTLTPSGTYQVTAIDGSSVVVLSVEPTSTPFVYGEVNESAPQDGMGTMTPSG
ncbi:DUF7096 domain-containing protein [Halobellus captivus]|uniref:DUF7096 domain-containing protein n=1 Tax=Halobellus captivus TaxID=2592614 RepID=UPI0011A0B351|nr:hypothetical protein [Halobellus captivus]